MNWPRRIVRHAWGWIMENPYLARWSARFVPFKISDAIFNWMEEIPKEDRLAEAQILMVLRHLDLAPGESSVVTLLPNGEIIERSRTGAGSAVKS